VGDTARREGELAGAAREDLVAELEGQLAFDDEERFVEVMVVKRRASASGEVDDRDLTAALFTAQQDSGWFVGHVPSFQRRGCVWRCRR
jgi:hypothetical protein